MTVWNVTVELVLHGDEPPTWLLADIDDVAAKHDAEIKLPVRVDVHQPADAGASR